MKQLFFMLCAMLSLCSVCMADWSTIYGPLTASQTPCQRHKKRRRHVQRIRPDKAKSNKHEPKVILDTGISHLNDPFQNKKVSEKVKGE